MGNGMDIIILFPPAAAELHHPQSMVVLRSTGVQRREQRFMLGLRSYPEKISHCPLHRKRLLSSTRGGFDREVVWFEK